MMELVEANWWLIVIALVIGVIVAWWIFAANRKTRVVRETPKDVLDEGAEPARRNQALIDSPRGSPLAPPPAPPVADPQPEPLTPAPEPEPEPEPVPHAAEPEPVIVQPEPAAAPEPEPVAIEPVPAAEPEPEPEPAPPAPEPLPAAAPEQAAAPAPAAPTADDLTRIKGLGPKLEKLLQGLGIVTYAQIAELSDSDIDRIDPQLGNFAGRIRRDSFVEQAKFLAAGDIAGFEAKFGAL